MKTGIELIAEERTRQIEKENWTSEHDDEHVNREIANASLSYTKHYIERAWNDEYIYRSATPPESWPWKDKYWKPKNPLSDLIKAGALIAAEIDRLQRFTNDVSAPSVA